ncbi:MAG: Virion structural protein [uncultured bacterium]|nr:MAG: Virion structural protein [uncultured bacterium]
MVTNTTNSNPIINLSDSAGEMSPQTNSIFEKLPTGSIVSAIGNSIYGINHRQTPGAIQINKDYFGLTFFTRPELNLTTANIQAIRQLGPLLTNERNSLQRIIRCLLDRRLSRNPDESLTSDLVDEQMAFIPMLTNHLLSISGWPDLTVESFTSQQGVYKESFSMIDSVALDYSTYNITANFRNIPGDPITLLFFIWEHYASNVFQGTMVPYPDKIIQNEIDYNTRIYRLVLDSSKTYVKKIAACGAAYPEATPIGAAFNYEHDRPINSSNDQISIPFKCMGAIYLDDILIYEFNKTSELFNDTLAPDADLIGGRIARLYRDGNVPTQQELLAVSTGKHYTKVSADALPIFNNRGYPFINPDSYELEWYVPNDMYYNMLPRTR